MSAVDRIRDAISRRRRSENRHGWERPVVIVPVDEAEALCDLADAARGHVEGCPAAEFGDRCPLCDALARLDGEATSE